MMEDHPAYTKQKQQKKKNKQTNYKKMENVMQWLHL